MGLELLLFFQLLDLLYQSVLVVLEELIRRLLRLGFAVGEEVLGPLARLRFWVFPEVFI